MSIDVVAAERFLYSCARLIDRHRAAVVLHGASTVPALAALAAYRNPDGGYGHGLEPDARGPLSETTSTLHALEVLEELGALDSSAARVTGWAAGIAEPDGSIPLVLESARRFPLAPWLIPAGGSHLTFGYAGFLRDPHDQWLAAATRWCWHRLEEPEQLDGYWLKYALAFLDRLDDADRADAAIDSLRPLLSDDGSVRVPGGTPDEKISALTLSPEPGRRSRALFTADQIDAGLDELESGQRTDGGWEFDWAAWAPAQVTDGRGFVTLQALRVLAANGRIAASPGPDDRS